MQGVESGRMLHGHKLLERIGEGRYGEVWRAEYLGQPVALKIFTDLRKPFEVRREALAQYALGRLEGEEGRHFPRVEHLDLEAQPPYIRMEFVDGTTLERLLEQGGLPVERRLELGERILEALSAVHRRGFIHGDLSPSNVLVGSDGGVRLIDIGYGAAEAGTDIAVSAHGSCRATLRKIQFAFRTSI